MKLIDFYTKDNEQIIADLRRINNVISTMPRQGGPMEAFLIEVAEAISRIIVELHADLSYTERVDLMLRIGGLLDLNKKVIDALFRPWWKFW